MFFYSFELTTHLWRPASVTKPGSLSVRLMFVKACYSFNMSIVVIHIAHSVYLGMLNIRFIFTEKLPTAPEDDSTYVPGDASGLKSFEGYGQVGFQQGDFLPPPPPPAYDEVVQQPMEFGT